MASPLGAAYIKGVAASQALFPHDFRAPSARIAATRHAASLGCAPGLAQHLQRHHDAWGMTDAIAQNIALLAASQREHIDGPLRDPREGVAVVITGQQAGLFLGPLYSFYKAATAIVVARDLAVESGRRVVPMFWLQTEDHDLAEIATAHLPSAEDEPRTLAYEASHDHRSAVEHVRFGDDVPPLYAALADALEGLPFAQESLALWESYARPGISPGDAFARALTALFGEEGLLIFKPRDPAIAPLAATVHRRAIDEAAELRAALLTREAAIEEAGFQVQIPTRPDTCLSFYHPEGPEGPRFRLMQLGDDEYGLAGHDGRYTRAELHQSLEETPMRWSTSALLRPLLQDTLLPTAAYVGGPGELSYFGQLQPLYQRMGLAMPLLVPRARFVLLEEGQQELLAQLGLSLDDLQADDATLHKQLELQNAPGPSPEELEAQLLAPFFEAIDELADDIAQLDPGLEKAVKKTRKHVAFGVEKLIGKIQRVRLQRDEQTAARLARLKAQLFPMGKPQERILGLPYFAARYGVDACKRAVFDAIKPYDASLQQLVLSPLKETS